VARSLDFQLLLITEGCGDPPTIVRRVRDALEVLPAGAAAIQVREKSLGTRALVDLCHELLPACHAHHAPLLVNDRCDLVLALGMDGLHLAQSSMTATDARAILGPSRLVGVSCHDAAELALAAHAADYACWGPIFAPHSKDASRDPIGLASLKVASRSGLPLFALGGIGPENAAAARAHGARGLAVIGAGLGSDEPGRSVTALWSAWNRAGG
jgi:thiamine-phosphate pyrophosphorylase